MKSSACDEIRAGLRSPEVNVRRTAVERLPELPESEALSLAGSIVEKHGELGMKLSLLYVLPRLATVKSAAMIGSLLAKLLGDDDSEVVRNAVLTMRQVPVGAVTEGAVDQLQRLTDHPDPDIRYLLAESLGSVKERELLPLVREALKRLVEQEPVAVRERAAEVLEELGT